MKTIILIFNVFFTYFVFGQVGINTNKPSGIFHVDAKADNNGMLNTENVKNDIVVSNSFGTEGYIGIGNSSPKVKLDVRGDDTSIGSSIAVGSNNITAEDAGGGAMRWNNGYLQYSNGHQWINIQSTTQKEKIVVIANKSDPLQISMYNPTYFGWNTVFDNSNSFYSGENFSQKDSSTSNELVYLHMGSRDIDYELLRRGAHFTSPRDGFYLATFTLAIKTILNANGNSWADGIQNLFYLDTNSDNPEDDYRGEDYRNGHKEIYNYGYNKNIYNCQTAFLSNTTNNQEIVVGGNCSVSIYMHQGEKLYPFTRISLVGAFIDSNGTAFDPLRKVNLLTDSSYNTLTIVEQ